MNQSIKGDKIESNKHYITKSLQNFVTIFGMNRCQLSCPKILNFVMDATSIAVILLF